MKVEGFRELKKEDVQEDFRPLIDTIGNSINNFARTLINVFNNNINIKDNLRQEIKQITLTVDSSGSPQITTSFQSKFGVVKIQGIETLRAENLTNTNTYPSNAPFVSFSQNGNIINILNCTGLQASQKYRLTILTIID